MRVLIADELQRLVELQKTLGSTSIEALDDAIDDCDYIDIVLCKDCKHCAKGGAGIFTKYFCMTETNEPEVSRDDFCSFGVMR